MQTWENNGKPEDLDPTTRFTGMLERPKVTDAKHKSREYLDVKAISGEANEDTFEKLGRFETALKKRVLDY